MHTQVVKQLFLKQLLLTSRGSLAIGRVDFGQEKNVKSHFFLSAQITLVLARMHINS